MSDAQRTTQEHIESALESAGERLTRWVREQGFDGAMYPRDAEYHAWRPAWYDKRKDEARVLLVLGGFCPVGFRKVDAKSPYLWVHTHPLERFKVKPPERAKFAQALRSALGPDAPSWDAEDVDDAHYPLGRTSVSTTTWPERAYCSSLTPSSDSARNTYRRFSDSQT